MSHKAEAEFRPSAGGQGDMEQRQPGADSLRKQQQQPLEATTSAQPKQAAQARSVSPENGPEDGSRSKSRSQNGNADQSGARKSSAGATLSRFKEKRPEPLKLSTNLNQEIPLDLSVKR